jgi:UDP-N-acetylmuramoyl-tripeptide--D-alanyl-D-alanine ligase
MTILWTNQTAANATGGKAQGHWQASRVEIDSRRIQPGDLFVALKGDNFDGHAYVEDAFKKGAVAAVVAHSSPHRGEVRRGAQQTSSGQASPHPNPPPEGEGNFLIVDDTLKALEMLGVYARKRSKAQVVGVTGSVGKTSAKEMLRLALSAHGLTYATNGNYNNHIGTPLNLANLPPNASYAVFEMGMNHAGEIAHLTKMVQPHIAAITNVEAVHMEFFDSVEAIAAAKAEIFQGMPAGGTAILNRDNPMYPLLAKTAKESGASVVTFGEHPQAQARLLDYGAGAGGSMISASIHGQTIRYTLEAIGRQWATTSLLVMAVANALGLDEAKTAHALSSFGELEGRGQVIPIAVDGGEALLVDDSYNASPAAMRAAFAKTAEVWNTGSHQGRKLAALGNMLELGPDAPKLHAGLAELLIRQDFDGVFAAGELAKHLYDALPPQLRAGYAADAAQLLPIVRDALRPGDVLLIKGSHGSKMYELAKALTSPSPLEGEGRGGGVSTPSINKKLPLPNPLPQGEREPNGGKKHAV